ncbi:MAG TPA: RHS repeat-associated core domain-containing protein [Acidimicrobiia bacterium]
MGTTRETVTYSYDDTNRGLPSGLTSDKPTDPTPLVSSVSWNELGAPLAATLGSGSNAVARVWEYQSDTLRLNKLEAGVGGNTTNRQNLQFSYFDDGNVAWIKDYGNQSQRQCFEYDDLSRLTDAYTIDTGCTGIADWSNSVGVGPYRRQYRYEANGNIDEVSTAGGSWDNYSYGAGSAGPHAVTSYLGWTYTYDANGNMETRTKTGGQDDDLTFDWNNRLAVYVADEGTANEVTTTMVYDAEGTRVARIETGGDATHYVGGIFEITNPAGSSTSRSYYSFNGQTVGYRHRVTGTGERRFLLSDHLGTNAVEVNETSGAVTEQYYLPFGDLRGSSSNGLGTDRTYTGQTADASTGLMFYNARYYLPALRRFISADTIVPNPRNPQEWNRYSYTGNSPANATDPTGHAKKRGGSSGLFPSNDATEPSEAFQLPPIAPPIPDVPVLPPVGPGPVPPIWIGLVAVLAGEATIELFEELGLSVDEQIFLSYLKEAGPADVYARFWDDCHMRGENCDVGIPVWRAVDKAITDDQGTPLGVYGMYWTTVPIDYYERFWPPGKDFSGAMEALALPPYNDYNLRVRHGITRGW